MIKETGSLLQVQIQQGEKRKGNVRDKRKRFLSKFGFKESAKKYMENDCKLEREKVFTPNPKEMIVNRQRKRGDTSLRLKEMTIKHKSTQKMLQPNL